MKILDGKKVRSITNRAMMPLKLTLKMMKTTGVSLRTKDRDHVVPPRKNKVSVFHVHILELKGQWALLPD